MVVAVSTAPHSLTLEAVALTGSELKTYLSDGRLVRLTADGSTGQKMEGSWTSQTMEGSWASSWSTEPRKTVDSVEELTDDVAGHQPTVGVEVEQKTMAYLVAAGVHSADCD